MFLKNLGVLHELALSIQRRISATGFYLSARRIILSGEVLMNANSTLQIIVYIGTVLILAKPLGNYMASIYEDEPAGLNRLLAPVEAWLYRLSGVQPKQEMLWTDYATAMLIFNLLGVLTVFALQSLQASLPFNPQHLANVSPDSAFNTAVSFATNTDWQGYSGETTLCYFTQMLGLTVQNFLSAATGMATLVALIRGFARRNTDLIGNFWVDLTRSTLYILMPLSLLLALALVGQGVVQTFSAYQSIPLVEAVHYETSSLNTEGKASLTSEVTKLQTIAVGPAASQVAIKQLGTNGGGFFNVNSAHPLENPTPLSNFLELLAILLIPAALCYTFGKMIGDTRQGWALLAVMSILFSV